MNASAAATSSRSRRARAFATAARPLLALIVIATIGCSLQDITFQDNSTDFSLPATVQFELDLPRSLAPTTGGGPTPVGAMLGSGPPCDSTATLGELFACATRFIFGEMVVALGNELNANITDVADEIANHDLPQGITFTFTYDPFDVSVLWSTTDGVTDYSVSFFLAGTTTPAGQWDWSIDADGNAGGEFILLADMFGGDADAPRGLRYVFESNASGDEKSLMMEFDLGDAPPASDPSAPTRLRLTADRANDTWTIMYGMYHPSWIPDTEDPVSTMLLVSAVGGVADDSPAVMKLVALEGGAVSVPPAAEEDHSICDYVVSVYVAEGWLPPGTPACVDDNPFYISSDGSVQVAGAVPAGFELYASMLDGIEFVTDNPAEIRNLSVTIDED